MDAQSGLIPDFISTLLWAGLLAILGVSAATFSWIDYSTSNVLQIFFCILVLNNKTIKLLKGLHDVSGHILLLGLI